MASGITRLKDKVAVVTERGAEDRRGIAPAVSGR